MQQRLDVTPAFELLEASGNSVRPPLLAARGKGHRQAARIDSDGPWLLGATLPPGRYTLRQHGKA